MLLSVLLFVLTLAGCLLFFFQPAWFPIPISAEALLYDHEFSRALWVAGVLFVAAQMLLAWTIARHRRARPLTAARASRKTELVWGAATLCAFLSMAALESRSWAKMPAGTQGKEIIRVEAHQFAWSFHYPGPDSVFGHTDLKLVSDAGGNPIGLDRSDPAAKDDIVASTLRVPAQRDVLLLMHSRDVIHDFFVRELRTKQDIVPGMEIPLELHVDVPGTYEIACAELCGLGHSQMRSMLIAMPPEDYVRWKAQKH